MPVQKAVKSMEGVNWLDQTVSEYSIFVIDSELSSCIGHI